MEGGTGKAAVGAGRRLYWLAIVYALALASWYVATLGVSLGLMTTNPALARIFNPDSPTIEMKLARLQEPQTLAEIFSLQADPAASVSNRELALRVLKSEPLSAEAFRLLGRAAGQAGDWKRAHAYLEESLRRSFRQPDVAAQLMSDSLKAADVPGTVLLADALLRGNQTRLAAAFTILAAVASNPATRPLVVDRLAAMPVWRAEFFEEISKTAWKEDNFLGLFSALEEAGAPMSVYEVKPFLFELAAREQTDAALTVWYKYIARSTLASMPLLYNSDFSLPVNDSPFNWTIDQPPNATVDVVQLADVGKTGIQIVFTNRRGEFAPVQQRTTLQPGSYRFSGLVRTDDFHSEEGLVWTIYCGFNKRLQIAQTARFFEQGQDWRSFEVDFKVPASECSLQNIRLELPAKISARQLASGSVWFASMSLSRLESRK